MQYLRKVMLLVGNVLVLIRVSLEILRVERTTSFAIWKTNMVRWSQRLVRMMEKGQPFVSPWSRKIQRRCMDVTQRLKNFRLLNQLSISATRWIGSEAFELRNH